MEKNKKNRVILVILLLVTFLILVAGGVAYAKYIATANGTLSAQIAKVICNMSIESYSHESDGTLKNQDDTIINPYCIITVNNFNEGENDDPNIVSEADIDFSVEVSPKQENGVDTFTMPEYYWYQIESPSSTTGIQLAHSTALSGQKLSNSQEQTKYYKIVFVNSGEEDITRYINFELKAVQDR